MRGEPRVGHAPRRARGGEPRAVEALAASGAAGPLAEGGLERHAARAAPSVVRREHRRLVRLLAVPHRLSRLPVARRPILADAALLPGLAFAGGAGVLILGADVRVALSSRHGPNVDIVVALAPGR